MLEKVFGDAAAQDYRYAYYKIRSLDLINGVKSYILLHVEVSLLPASAMSRHLSSCYFTSSILEISASTDKINRIILLSHLIENHPDLSEDLPKNFLLQDFRYG